MGLSTAEVAAKAGVHRDTLLRWLREGLIEEPARDQRGWRVFSETEAEVVSEFAKGRREGSDPLDPVRRDYHRTLSRLEALDWDFRGVQTNYFTHGLHPYPAKFIPQIPNALIQELSSVGDRVADIFCGSGTTLVEAMLLKRNSVGVDANPLSALITRAKTTRLSTQDVETLGALADRADTLGMEIGTYQGEGLLFDFPPFTSNAPRPDDESLEFWFEPFVVEELAELISWCRELRSSAARTVSLASASAIIVAVSKQDSDTRYVRREKNLSPGDTMRRFAKALRDTLRGLLEFADLVETRFRCDVIHADVLDAPDIGEIDLVVCSPPYPNAYSYHLYHRSRMVWLGMDQPEFKRREIGSHRKYSRKGERGATPATFRDEMGRVFHWLTGHLKPSGFACFVVGDSTIKGERIDNASILCDAGKECGFSLVSQIERQLQATKKAFNPSIGKIKTEHILIFSHRPGLAR